MFLFSLPKSLWVNNSGLWQNFLKEVVLICDSIFYEINLLTAQQGYD